MWFRKKLVLAAARPSELSIEEQDCGTWYGCRWKPHTPVDCPVGDNWNYQWCATCGKRITFDGCWDMGGDWVIDEFIINEEEEI